MNSKIFPFIYGLAIGAGVMIIFNYAKTKDIVFHDLPEPYYKVLYDNEDVRIVEHIMQPKDEEPLHIHPKMYAYFLEDCELRVKNGEGEVTVRGFKKGQNFLGGDISHSIENIGITPLHSLIIELNE